MRVMLTSNFPRPGNDEVAAAVRDTVDQEAGLEWLSPADGASRFDEARQALGAYGHAVRALDRAALASPSAGAGLVLSGGDPITFRAELLQPSRRAWLQHRVVFAPIVVAASGGAMQLTPNVSLFRLLDNTVSAVVHERDRYGALGCVPFEVLPHLERQSPAFIGRVLEYSAQAAVDIWCLPDGAAVDWNDISGATAIGTARLLRRGRWVDDMASLAHA
jgi:peptidase E